MPKRASKSGGSGGIGGGIASLSMLALVLGIVLAWVNVNNITGPAGVYDYFKSLSDKVESCGAVKAVWHCQGNISTNQKHLPKDWNSNTPNTSGNNSIPGGITSIDATNKISNNIKNYDFNPANIASINQGAPTAAAPKNVFDEAVKHLNTTTKLSGGYNRSDWKHWIGEPCNTREKVLQSQGKNVKVDTKTCKILSGSWVSSYDSVKTADNGTFDIDHVIPLGYAAAHGGQTWSVSKKQAFANDTSQLLAVSANSNRSKSDKGPSQYMPQESAKCLYTHIWIATAIKYGVSLSPADKQILSTTQSKCQ